jgi:hypothetical protein
MLTPNPKPQAAVVEGMYARWKMIADHQFNRLAALTGADRSVRRD